jgi:hypothetical protein
MPAESSPGPGQCGEDVPPHPGDDWGQEAVLDDLMAAFGSGPEEDPPDDGFGPGLGFGPGHSFGPGLDEFQPGPGAGLEETFTGEGADPVPESMDAGFLPRGGPGRPKLVGGGPGAGFASGAELDTARPGPALAGFADDAAGGGRRYRGLDDDQLIGALLGWQKTEAWAAAGKLSAVAELIRRRPGDAARGGGPDGPPAVWGKFCADELAVAVASSQRAAERMLGVAYDLAFRLPLTARALREGRLDSYKAQIIAEVTRVLDNAAAAAAEALIAPGVAGKTPGQIRVMIGRAVLQVDPDAARQRREQAQRDARVGLWREDAGTAALCGFGLPPDEALAAGQMITSRARELKTAGMAGTMDKLRVRAYLDILLGQDSSPALAGQDPPGRGNTEATPRSNTRDPAKDPAKDPADDPADDPAGRPDRAADQPGGGGDQTGQGTGADSHQDRDTDNHTGRETSEPAGPGTGNQTGRATGEPAGMAARINLTVPLATLLGLAERPGEAGGFGPVDPDLARALANSAATHPATTWCLTVTDSQGHPTAHGCARPTRRAGPQQPDSRAGPGPGPDARSPGGAGRNGGLGGYRTWRIRPVPGSPDLTIDLEPLAVTDCDHRYETAAHDPSDRLRHLIHIRDGECTWPPCRRAARRCDFEHAIPWEAGGVTCACNAGPPRL